MISNSHKPIEKLRLIIDNDGVKRNTRASLPVTVLLALVSLLMLLSTLIPTGASAAAGDLDPTFGTAGMVTTAFAGGAAASAIQPDGRIIAAGWTLNDKSAPVFALARYKADGRLDTSFGSGGKVTTAFGDNAKIQGIALQPDGRIVAAGSGKNGSEGASIDFAVARYNSDGSLDPSFGNGGKVTTDFFGKHDQVYAVAIQQDGRIVAAGGATPVRGGFGFALARYNNDGRLDSSFGVGGKVTTAFAPNQISEAHALAIQGDGKIVAAGSGSPGFGMDFALARYNIDGTLDPAFGVAGRMTTDFAGSEDQARALAIQRDGRIIAAGYAGLGNRPSTDFGLARYNSDGRLDSTFGSDGRVTTDFFGGYDGVSALALEPDGLIVAAGMVAFHGASDFGLARYRGNGTLDSTFGSRGKVNTEINGAGGWASSVAIQPDGKIVAAGNALNPTTGNDDFAVVRYAYEPYAKNQASNIAESSTPVQ